MFHPNSKLRFVLRVRVRLGDQKFVLEHRDRFLSLFGGWADCGWDDCGLHWAVWRNLNQCFDITHIEILLETEW